MNKQQAEPWLRGTHRDVIPVARGAIHAIELAEENLAEWCGKLSEPEINAKPFGLPSIAFHLRHIARSLDRLLTYAEGFPLNEQQLAVMQREETEEESSGAKLFEELSTALKESCKRITKLGASQAKFYEPRFVGRRKLSTTIPGLLVHIADHTQRHVGQAITTAKILMAQRSR
ncbi:MAG: DinB family protein [Acidobacteriota bacterium]|nr:DinB family protein [Acidobacteriota bacterium]